jgi:hypothetical protein
VKPGTEDLVGTSKVFFEKFSAATLPQGVTATGWGGPL